MPGFGVHKDSILVFVAINADGNESTATLNLARNLSKMGGDIDFTRGIQGPMGKKEVNIKGNFSQTAGTIRLTIEDVDIQNPKNAGHCFDGTFD